MSYYEVLGHSEDGRYEYRRHGDRWYVLDEVAGELWDLTPEERAAIDAKYGSGR